MTPTSVLNPTAASAVQASASAEKKVTPSVKFNREVISLKESDDAEETDEEAEEDSDEEADERSGEEADETEE